MYETIAITDLELFIYMIGRGSQPHEALENMIEHEQELKHTRQYLIAMIDDIDKSEDKNES
jgi:hypothetical protein